MYKLFKSLVNEWTSPKENPKVKTHIDAMRTTEMNFLVDGKTYIFYREEKSVKLDEKIHLHI